MSKKLVPFLLICMLLIFSIPQTVGDISKASPGSFMMAEGAAVSAFYPQTSQSNSLAYVPPVDRYYLVYPTYSGGNIRNRWAESDQGDYTTWTEVGELYYPVAHPSSHLLNYPSGAVQTITWDNITQCLWAGFYRNYNEYLRIYVAKGTVVGSNITFASGVLAGEDDMYVGNFDIVSDASGRPVLCIGGRDDTAGSVWRTKVYFGQSDAPASFEFDTVVADSLSDGTRYSSIAPINETGAVYLVEGLAASEDKLYGGRIDKDTADWGALPQLSDNNVKTWKDLNNVEWMDWSMAYDPIRAHITYQDTAFDLYYFTVDFNTFTKSDETMIYNGTSASQCYQPAISVNDYSPSIFFWNKSTVPGAITGYAIELNSTNQWTIDSPLEICSSTWSTTQYPIARAGSVTGNSNTTIVGFGNNGGDCPGTDYAFSGYGEPTGPTFEDVIITNPETVGGELWVYAEWQYYDFQATVSHTNATGGNATDFIDQIHIEFTDDWNNMEAIYFVQNDSMSLASDNPTVYSLAYGGFTTSEDSLNVTFRILFYGASIDARDIDIDGFVNDTIGVFDGLREIKSDYFNLYVFGGDYEVTVVSGSGGHIPGGAWNDLYASENSTVSSTVTFRHLQHFRILNSIYAANVTGPDFELQYYIQVNTEEEGWFTVCSMFLEAESGATGSDRYIMFNTTFYESGVLDPDASFQGVYFFHRANVGAGSGDPTQTEVWIDGWLDRENRSTVVGIRANAYYYPMKDSADVWFRWLSTNWGVNDDLRKDIAYRCPMYESDSADLVTTKEVTMVRLTYVLAVSAGDGGAQSIETTNYQTADYSFSPLSEDMVAVETPPAMETLIPAMPAGGWMGAILNGFRWLADVLIPGLGGLAIWNQMVDFLDSIAAQFGAPNFFRNLINWFASFVGWLGQSLGYLLIALAEIFTFLAVFMGSVLSIFVEIIGAWIDMASWFVSIMGDGLGTGINIWNDFNITQWLVLAAILYPMWLVFMWDEEGIEPVYRHLTFVRGILEFAFNFFMAIAQFAINLIGRVIESIPVVE